MQAALLRILAIAAVLFASLTMASSHAAMAAPAAAGMDHSEMAPASAEHCADKDRKSQDQPISKIGCLIACSVLPTLGGGYVFERLATSSALTVAAVAGIHGIDLQADTPPPRSS